MHWRVWATVTPQPVLGRPPPMAQRLGQANGTF